MNATQYTLPAGLADLSPFDIKVTAETPTPSPDLRNAVCRAILTSGVETDAGYGCVDWYQYPSSRAYGPIATNSGT
jgi:hypothetical protein